MRYLLLGVAVLIISLSTDAFAMDACHAPAWERPDRCHDDDRVAALPANVRENHIFFTRGGTELDPSAQEQLSLLTAALATDTFRGTCIRLVGHADSGGDAGANLTLSEKRAQAVQSYMHEMLGRSRIPIEVVALGESEPLSGLNPASAVQRRVAIWARHCGLRG